MLSTPSSYTFTSLREEDLDLVRRWLLEPHVKRWWDDGLKMPYPEATIEEYREAIQGKDPTYHYLAWIDGRRAGMFQHYRIGDDPEYAAALALGEDAIGVDLFIGEADLVGQAHGPAMIRQFLRGRCLPIPPHRGLRDRTLGEERLSDSRLRKGGIPCTPRSNGAR